MTEGLRSPKDLNVVLEGSTLADATGAEAEAAEIAGGGSRGAENKVKAAEAQGGAPRSNEVTQTSARHTLLQAGFCPRALGATGFCRMSRSYSEEFLACFFSSAGSRGFAGLPVRPRQSEAPR